MNEQDGIDYEALAKAAFFAQQGGETPKAKEHWDNYYITQQLMIPVARAVIAAYRQQRAARGFVELRTDDASHLLNVYEYSTDDPDGPEYDATLVRRVAAAVMAHAPAATGEPGATKPPRIDPGSLPDLTEEDILAAYQEGRTFTLRPTPPDEPGAGS